MKQRIYLATILLLAATLACGETTPTTITISGTIASTDGSPPAAAYVALFSLKDDRFATDPTLTDETGRYQLEAPGGRDYVLFVIPFSGQAVEGYNLHGHTAQVARIETGDENTVRDFTLTPCHDYIFEGYDADGTLALNDDWVGVRFAEDTAGNATTDIYLGIGKDGMPEMPGVCVPLGQRRRFFVQWTVPEFGNIVLAADNGGAGYTASEPGGTVLNLNYELARTQVSRLRTNLNDYQATGYNVSPTIADELARAEALLAQAATQERAEQSTLADQATRTSLWSLEDLELVRAKQDIPRHRQGTLTVTVLDAAGNPVPGATVTYNQISHDFLFGIFDTLGDVGVEGYDLMQQAGVNYLTAGFYWGETEPKQNRIAWEKIDHEIGVLDLAEMGFSLKAHALIALWDFATPDYLKAMSFDALDQEVYEHTSALVSRYRDQIDIWNVINEAHGRSAALDLSREEITTLTETGIRAIRENDPDARIIINSAFDWHGEGGMMAALMTGETDDFTLSVPAYLDQLAADGVQYDIIGQQFYNGGHSGILAAWGLGDPLGVSTWDLAHISALLDRLGEYGKPVHITEQSVSSIWGSDWAQVGAGWWHRHWDEETQAEFLHDFYTIAFSKKHVEAITWWDINDGDSFITTGGLLDAENNPKPAYYALRDLVAGWTTLGQGETDAAGQITIQGYGGKYDLTITNDDETWRGAVHIWEQQGNEITVESTSD